MHVRSLALACSLLIAVLAAGSPAAAMVGGAPPADPALSRRLVLIVGSRGNFCTGTALARDLVLTAAHCVVAGADYKVIERDAGGTPQLRDIARVVPHPQFSLEAFSNHRVTADVALVKTARPLPVEPTAIGELKKPVAPGDRFTVAGFGVAVPGDGKTGGTARAANLVVTGQPGSLQIRLMDGQGKGERAGLGACTGDSGAPAFDLAGATPVVVGVVSWTTGPKLSAGCGGLTGVTPLARYRDWIAATARTLGNPLR